MAQNSNWYPQPDKRKGHRIASLPSDKRHLKSTRSSSMDKSIESIVFSISRSNIERWINDLASFHTRHTKSRFIDEAANWLKGEVFRLALAYQKIVSGIHFIYD